MHARSVRGILAGIKTQTRRVLKARAEHGGGGGRAYDRAVVGPFRAADGAPLQYGATLHSGGGGDFCVACPYGQPGHRLWVREAWATAGGKLVADRADGRCGAWCGDSAGGWFFNPHGYVIEANREHGPSFSLAKYGGRWKPSIHMPRWASRLTLEVTEVRVERVQAISEADAGEEGSFWRGTHPEWDGDPDEHRKYFREAWDTLNAERGFGWDANPWVWVIAFQVVVP